ncbi:SRPBCC family protein [Gordonia sp. HNM0687]|uniref:SRPBCC family protein n=1 Tax=Gordonia mangrovi TaxID=2665643 RepID=A0A6L7GWL9_9ACTN|nr:SRPBCC family protein [Gordonia mangrovi]MXP23877.1 SRPBCC family protein [Gordonia mangrovi]UVF76430.1 SRPBCC family protein [Gordonia mangrovi]
MAAPLIEESIVINASAEDVWAVISDLERMGEWSPQCKKMIIRGGEVALGTKTININRRGPLVWPTTSKVVRFAPNKEIAFRVAENRTVWSYTIEPSDTGVKVIEKREVGDGTTKVSSFFVDKLLGGASSFEEELKLGMAETLGKIKRAAEASAARAA